MKFYKKWPNLTTVLFRQESPWYWTWTELGNIQVSPKWYPGIAQNNVYKLSKYWTNNSQILSKYYPNIISPLTRPPGQKWKPEATHPKIISVSKYYSDIIKILSKY